MKAKDDKEKEYWNIKDSIEKFSKQVLFFKKKKTQRYFEFFEIVKCLSELILGIWNLALTKCSSSLFKTIPCGCKIT